MALYTLEYDSNDSHSRSSKKVGAKVGQMGLFHRHGAAKFGLASLLIGVLHFHATHVFYKNIFIF